MDWHSLMTFVRSDGVMANHVALRLKTCVETPSRNLHATLNNQKIRNS